MCHAAACPSLHGDNTQHQVQSANQVIAGAGLLFTVQLITNFNSSNSQIPVTLHSLERLPNDALNEAVSCSSVTIIHGHFKSSVL